MESPTLTVIGGCNGAGKSSFSKAITYSNYLETIE
jgi:predicted ABC-type ATPase